LYVLFSFPFALLSLRQLFYVVCFAILFPFFVCSLFSVYPSEKGAF